MLNLKILTRTKLKENLFFIGVIIFSLTIFLERLLSIDTNFAHFVKGFGVGLQLIGVIFLFMRKK